MGFEIERFIDDVDEEFICPICSGVLEDPLQTPDCEHAFCRTCITEWISRQPNCPVDRQPVTASQLRPAPRFMRNVLSRLSTSCDYAPQGCNAVLKLESLASHLVECEFNPKRPVPCEAGCGLVIPKGELAKHNCVRELRALIVTHQEKLNVYEQELAENKRVHQEKLNDYKRELAENKRVHQEKLNDYEQELAELKRELAELKEFKQERLLNPSTRAAAVPAFVDRVRGASRPLPANRLSPAGQLNPSTSAQADEREREEVVRWSNTLERGHVYRWYANFPIPGIDLLISIRRSLSESGCPPHILDDLMKNCFPGRWPPSIRTYRDARLLQQTYVCKRVPGLPGQEAVVILDCDNTHVDQQQMVKPGFIVTFPFDGIS